MTQFHAIIVAYEKLLQQPKWHPKSYGSPGAIWVPEQTYYSTSCSLSNVEESKREDKPSPLQILVSCMSRKGRELDITSPLGAEKQCFCCCCLYESSL